MGNGFYLFCFFLNNLKNILNDVNIIEERFHYEIKVSINIVKKKKKIFFCEAIDE